MGSAKASMFVCKFFLKKIAFLDVNIYKGPSFHISKRLDFEHLLNRQAYVHTSSYRML